MIVSPCVHLNAVWVQVRLVPDAAQRGVELKTLEEKVSHMEMQHSLNFCLERGTQLNNLNLMPLYPLSLGSGRHWEAWSPGLWYQSRELGGRNPVVGGEGRGARAEVEI